MKAAAAKPARARQPPWRDSQFDDAQLLAAAIERQDWAWPAIVERYSRLVGSIASSYRLHSADAAEVQQEVWMLLFEHMDDIRHPERLCGWIGSVTRNECLRKVSRCRREVPTDDEAPACESEDDVDGQILARERHVALHRAMVALPDDRGRALLETILEQPSIAHRELAEKLDMPIGSIGPTRQRSLRKLSRAPELALLRCA